MPSNHVRENAQESYNLDAELWISNATAGVVGSVLVVSLVSMSCGECKGEIQNRREKQYNKSFLLFPTDWVIHWKYINEWIQPLFALMDVSLKPFIAGMHFMQTLLETEEC